MKKISIVTVCYNAVKVIEKTIASVINQTFSNIEYIVIDGGSTDGTLDVIKKYERNIVYWCSEPDKGIYDAMNKGILRATGDYILFLNSGDTFYNDAVIEEVERKIENCISVVFGDVALVMDGVKYQMQAKPFYEHLPLHHSMGFNHQCTFVRTDVAKKKLFDLNYKLAADYNMIISIYRNGGTFQQLNNFIISTYDMDGVSEQKRRMHIYETLMIDNPNRKLFNRFYSYYLSTKLSIGRNVGKLLTVLSSQYMRKRRAKYMIIIGDINLNSN